MPSARNNSGSSSGFGIARGDEELQGDGVEENEGMYYEHSNEQTEAEKKKKKMIIGFVTCFILFLFLVLHKTTGFGETIVKSETISLPDGEVISLNVEEENKDEAKSSSTTTTTTNGDGKATQDDYNESENDDGSFDEGEDDDGSFGLETPTSFENGIVPDPGVQKKESEIFTDEFYDRVRSNGVICLSSKYGRLNNQILAVRGGLVFAHLLNRTLVIPATVSKLFDADELGKIAPHIAVRFSRKLCRKPKANSVLTKLCKKKLGCDLRDNELVDRLRKQTADNRYLGIDGQTLFRNSRWASHLEGFPLERLFYRHLFPQKPIRDIASNFIEENFKGKEFAAVHLRWLEGSCYYRVKIYNKGIGKMLCSPKRDVYLEVMNDVIHRTDMPIFVASDRQREGALESYTSNGGYLYKGACSGFTCAVIDFEIAARSNFFIGVIVSTASDTIANLRAHRRVRDVGTQYPSVLSWSRNETEKNFNSGGYFRLRDSEKGF